MRALWGTLSGAILVAVVLMSLGILAHTGVTESPTPVVPLPPSGWQPVTLGMAIMLTDYSDREDWSGCETRGTSPLFVRCPDGYTLEVR